MRYEMILKYAALIFLVFGSMIFAANCILTSASYQAAPDGWVMALPKPAGTNENLSNLVGLGIIDENTLVETGLRGASNQATSNSKEMSLLNSAGKTEDLNNLVGLGIIDKSSLVGLGLVDNTQIDDNLSSKDLGELEDNNSTGILNAALNNTTEITQYLTEI
jgi:hypothetical protein